MKSRVLAVCGLLGTLAVAASLGAKSTPQDPDEAACRPDVQRLCGDIHAGHGKIVSCLRAHEHDLSSACRERWELHKKEVSQFIDACRGDARKYCSDVRPGRERILSCLKVHERDLSDSCKSEFS